MEARKRAPKLLLILVALTALATVPATAQAASGCAAASVEPRDTSLRNARGTVRCLLNRERAMRGLRALRPSGRLNAAAGRHSRDMGARGYFEHERPGGPTLVQRIQRTGYLSNAGQWLLAENIGWGSGSYSTPRAMVQGWMGSPGHRRNILNGRLREIGIGIVLGAPVRGASASLHAGSAIYTTDFGVRG